MKLSKTLIIFILLMIFVLNISIVSALEFDNIKNYDRETKTIEIRNSVLGIPFLELGKVAEIKLKSDLKVIVPRGYQKVAEFEVRVYEDYNNPFKELELFNLNKQGKKFIRDYDYRYRNYVNVLVDDYKTECSLSKNGTNICKQVVSGSHYEQQEEWVKLNPSAFKKNENLTIGIFTNVEKGDYVEWIPNYFGVRINEFAIWREDLNVGLLFYYQMDETTGTNVTDATDNGNHGTAQNIEDEDWTTGKINNGLDLDGDPEFVLIPHNDSLNITGNLSIAVWVKLNSLGTYQYLVHKGAVSASGCNYYLNVLDTNYLQFGFYSGASWHEHADTQFQLTKDVWYFIVVNYDHINVRFYVNNTAGASPAENSNFQTNTLDMEIGRSNTGVGNYYLNGTIDEVSVRNRTLNTTEIEDLWNNGDGLSYGDFGDEFPSIVINSINSTNYTSEQNITMNFTAWDNKNLSSVNLYVNDILNQTNVSGLNNTEYLFNLNLGEGDYTIYGKATDNESQETNSNTVIIIIDSQSPIINITYPLNGSEIITFTNLTNVSFNASISDLHLSTCWYYNGTDNVTITCGNNATLSLEPGDHNLAWYANDTLGNKASSYVSFLINYIQETASYPNPTIEGETVSVNLTISAIELTSLSGTLYYNGTAYNTTSSIVGSIGTLNTNLLIDAVNASIIKSFYWNYTLNGENYTTSTYNHTIYFINPINVSTSCSAGLSSAMCFDFKDELNLTALNGSINYNFGFGVTNTSYKEAYGSLTGISNFCLCVNSTIYNNYTLGEGEIQYSKVGYADRRFYTFSTQRLTNSTINNTLYLLPSTSATSFLFDFKDTNLAPYTSRYTTLLRWYPNLNEYKIVEMSKTDDKGETIMRVEVEDTDYRVGLYETNGSLITLLNPVRFACISAPCSYSSLVDSAEKDYTSFFDVEGAIEFNETTNIWTLTWNDPTQNTQTMNLLVTRERGDSSYTICDVSASGFTGILTCDSTGYTGTLVATAYRTASPATPIFQKIINTISSPFSGIVGLFISFILVTLLMLIGVYSPVASVILGIIALLPALYMGVVTLAIFIAIAVLGGIIIHFMKRTG